MIAAAGAASAPQVRCAIYTRKSTEEGLAQPFNSLHAQREAAESYVHSQQSQGWVLLPTRYDDGGFTGANMERPALKRLLADIAAGQVDCVLVYKVDRLSRSLLDFARIMEIFERHSAAFVSVTQQFNTAASLGRLTLNILLSFAQFEREIISERTRDKQAAARRKGKWTGGRLVLGYDLDPSGAGLRINEAEAERVRAIFDLSLHTGSLEATLRELAQRGWTNKSWTTQAGGSHRGGPFREDSLKRLLTNKLYIGRVRQGEQDYAGEHPAIVAPEAWHGVQRLLAATQRGRKRRPASAGDGALSAILFCATCGGHLRISGSRRLRKRSRYICPGSPQSGTGDCVRKPLPADDLERIVEDAAGGDIAHYVERVTWAGDRDQLTIRLKDQSEMLIPIERVRVQRGRIMLRVAGPQRDAQSRVEGCVPRISRLMALALRLEELLRTRATGSEAELARAGNVTRSRIRQILNLLDLAPDIQEQLLFLPRSANGRDSITEQELRRITTEPDWERQRTTFAELMRARAA
ncbi:MAG TPA: recombinase family protein [Bryobacteraceae bacterium]|nr:recombinase family protein [Bryobacteraceae bacterium]